MTEGDYGVAVPFSVGGITLTSSDRLLFTFKKGKNGETILTKEYTPSDNAVSLEFTAADSAKFPAGAYVYSLDHYQTGSFLENLIECAQLKVGDKA